MSPPYRTQDLTRRKFFGVAGRSAAGLLIFGVAACDSSGNGDETTQVTEGGGSGSPATESAAFSGEAAVAHLDAIIQAAPFVIAQELDLYQEEGLELDLVSFPGGTDTIRGVVSGIPLGMPATLPGLIAYEKGNSDLRLVSGAYNDAAVVFIVPADSDIESIDDLEGKKIAVSQPGSITTYFSTRIVEEQGLEPGQNVEIINVGGPGDAWTSAKQGVTDVAWSNPPLSERLIAEGEARMLFTTNEFVENWCDNTYWTTQSFIDQSPDVIERFLRTQQKAMDLINNDVDRAAAAYAQRTNLDEAVAREALEGAASAFSLEIDMPGIEENIKAGVEMGTLTDADLDLDAIIVDDFLPS